jgi:pSer/pThr/pTyr-binding forkhead associated (FHA) protein
LSEYLEKIVVKTLLTFQVYKGNDLQEITFTQDFIKVGRLDSSHLRIDDDSVSRIHAIIEVERNGEVYIVDLGSIRGTFVNSERINRSLLSNGDELTFGNVKVVINFVIETVLPRDMDGSPLLSTPSVEAFVDADPVIHTYNPPFIKTSGTVRQVVHAPNPFSSSTLLSIEERSFKKSKLHISSKGFAVLYLIFIVVGISMIIAGYHYNVTEVMGWVLSFLGGGLIGYGAIALYKEVKGE